MRSALTILYVAAIVALIVGAFVYAVHLVSTPNFVLDLPMK
jgi:hypothetical protein